MGLRIETVAKFSEELLATTLWVRILASFFFFFLDGVFWATIFQFYFPFLLGNAAFASTFRDLSLIIGTIYGYFVSSQSEGYTNNIRLYRTLIRKIKTANLDLVGQYNSLEEELRSDVKVHVTRLKVAYQFLSFYSYRLFAPSNRDELGLKESVPRVSYQETMSENLGQIIDATVKVYEVADIPEELLEIKSRELMDRARGAPRKSAQATTLCLIDALHIYIMRELSHLQRRGLNDVLLDKAIRPIEQVWSAIENIEIDQDIQEPAIFNAHYGIILVFFFIVWIPIQMWTLLGYLGGIVLYPFVAYTFLAFAVYRGWIGDPFSSNRPTMLAPVLIWRHNAIRDIDARFNAVQSIGAYV